MRSTGNSGTLIFPEPSKGAPADTAKPARNRTEERTKIGPVFPGSRRSATPARRVPRAQPREPQAANVPITRSADRAYARSAGGYIPTQNPRNIRVRSTVTGSPANTWRNDASAPRTSATWRILRLPWMSAARPNT